MLTIDERLNEIAHRLDLAAAGSQEISNLLAAAGSQEISNLLAAMANLLEVVRARQTQIEAHEQALTHLLVDHISQKMEG